MLLAAMYANLLFELSDDLCIVYFLFISSPCSFHLVLRVVLVSIHPFVIKSVVAFFFHFGRKIIIVECAENAFEKHVSMTHGKETHLSTNVEVLMEQQLNFGFPAPKKGGNNLGCITLQHTIYSPCRFGQLKHLVSCKNS